MEELQVLKSGGVSFLSQHKVPPYTNEKWENPRLSRAVKHSTMESKHCDSIYNQSLDSAKSPTHAMEYLCRPWSSSASDFQQIFSSSNSMLPFNAIDEIEEQEETKAEKTIQNHAMNNRYISNKGDKRWMDFNHMKGWLKGKPLTKFSRSNREKKKEEIRLHSAKLHAALSLTQLAAAIASFATTCKTERPDFRTKIISKNTLEWDQDMDVAAASAAVLLTTVFAETAESLGAKRTRVASAVKSGLATETPIDMITLTATAATCLRGAAALNSRAQAEAYFPINQELLKVSAQISVLTPGGEEFRWVTINLKQRQVILSIRKKYLGGALTASREYKIIDVIEDIKDIKGCDFLSLQTNKGIIKLLFDDEKQSIIWISTISNLLQMHNSC